MKDELISYETAQLAKEKGFKIKTPYVFLLNSDKIVPFKNHIRECLAPTQSLLQRWLREKYNIHISVKATNTKTPNNSFEVLVSRNNERDYFHYGYFDYENSLEGGLLNALKLIKL